MKIETVDLFYLSMPEILDIGDGSQDALLVRVRAGGFEGWGECEASPLTSIAGYVCPMSHSACKPVMQSVIGHNINTPEDIDAIAHLVHAQSLDLLQADHILSGIDIALWDLLGKKNQAPVYQLLGYKKSYPKLAYASHLFGESPELTFEKVKKSVQSGFHAIKLGWSNFGVQPIHTDHAHLMAAREAAGKNTLLMIDAGTAWKNNVNEAALRLQKLKEINAHWLEEPFSNGNLSAYKQLSVCRPTVPLAGGEGCNNYYQAKAMIDHAGLSFIQIDAGRIGGITQAKKIVDMALLRNVTYVNHTFTSHLALSASLQPYAGLEAHHICEYPAEPKSLAVDITLNYIKPDNNGYVTAPQEPGLGIIINTEAIKKYVVDTQITVNGKILYKTPEL